MLLVKTRRRVATSILIMTALSLMLSLPATLVITYFWFGGDFSRTRTGWEVLRFALEVTFVECATVCPIVAYRGVVTLRALDDLRNRLQKLASRDPLTGLLNRRGFDESVAALPQEGPLSVLVCDIDHFKRVNDRYGHATGDVVLRMVADLLAELAETRSEILVARFGGEEFVVAIPDADLEMARFWADVARLQLVALRARGPEGPIAITASFGVAAREHLEEDASALIARADRALFLAKSQGRNRVAAEHDAPRGAFAA